MDDDPPGDTSNDVIQILSDDEYEGNPSGLAKETSVISISSSTADKDMSSTSEQGRFTSKEDKGQENGPLSEANSVVSIRSSTDEELSLPEIEIEKEPRPNIPSEVTVEEFLELSQERCLGFTWKTNSNLREAPHSRRVQNILYYYWLSNFV